MKVDTCVLAIHKLFFGNEQIGIKHIITQLIGILKYIFGEILVNLKIYTFFDLFLNKNSIFSIILSQTSIILLYNL